MHTFLRRLSLVALLFAMSAPTWLHAEDSTRLVVGGVVPAIEAKDQHDQDFKLGDDTEWVLIAFDMGTGRAANGKLEKKGAGWLDGHKAVYISNIHGMPGIGRMFALPKMRKYPHRIILADQEGLLDPFPQEDGRVTVLKLEPGRVIEAITYWDPRKDDAPF
jgi:hypothetical protein